MCTARVGLSLRCAVGVSAIAGIVSCWVCVGVDGTVYVVVVVVMIITVVVVVVIVVVLENIDVALMFHLDLLDKLMLVENIDYLYLVELMKKSYFVLMMDLN